MQPIFEPNSLRKVLERGLIAGLWSVSDFNTTGEPILPSIEFLAEHEQFRDYNFRDLRAFAERQQPPLPF